MRFYVICKFHQDSQERIYVTFEREPQTRAQVPPFFNLTCPILKASNPYLASDVKAEVGAAPIGGAALGALLFLIDPLLGLAGVLIGALGANATEQEKVNAFNES